MKVSKKKIWKGKEYYKIEQKKNKKEKEKRALQSVKIIVRKVHKRRQWQNTKCNLENKVLVRSIIKIPKSRQQV